MRCPKELNLLAVSAETTRADFARWTVVKVDEFVPDICLTSWPGRSILNLTEGLWPIVYCPYAYSALLFIILLSSPAAVAADTVQNFDTGNGICATGSACLAEVFANGPAPELMPGGPTGLGRFLRLAYGAPEGGTPNFNTVTFREIGDVDKVVLIGFYFRMIPGVGRADGFAFSLLNADLYSDMDVGGTAEEPNFIGSLGVGFDVYRNEDLNDVGNVVLGDFYSNSVSVHYDGAIITQVDASPIIDLACEQWIQARIEVHVSNSVATVSVALAPPDAPPITLIEDLPIPDFEPYPARVHFGARSGGGTADQDIDEISVRYVKPSYTEFRLPAPVIWAYEHDQSVTVPVIVTGDLSRGRSVSLRTHAKADADPGDDFAGVSEAIPAVVAIANVVVPLVDDALAEGDEYFEVELRRPEEGATLGGPARAGVIIVDDELARERGHWGPLSHLPIVAVHAHLLPSGEVAYWDRLGSAAIWNPRNGQSRDLATPGYNLFCSSHAFLPDGLLLVTGGHSAADGHSDHDGIGLVQASLFDWRTETWTPLPDMTDGRWYPTNTPLPNGNMLVISGSHDVDDFRKNLLPQVWRTSAGDWRDLTNAQDFPPYGVDLYPRMLVAPDGRVFKAGPDADTWFLDTAGTGAWEAGPVAADGPRVYGTATMFAPGRLLVTGGSDGGDLTPAFATAEVIDLNDPAPAWRSIDSMTEPRRHHNSAMLPDGTVLVTGGTRGPGFDNPKETVYLAELWNPDTEDWLQMDSMRMPRVYHSVALLLPDGSVLTAGSGQGAALPWYQNMAEVFRPPYLFKDKRPKIKSAPETVGYGEEFLVECTQRSRIAKVTLTRLASVTHSVDINQGFATLEFAPSSAGVTATAPAGPRRRPAITCCG